MPRLCSTIVLCGLLLNAAAHTLSAQPFFTGIGNLNGGSTVSSAGNVSADGIVTVGTVGIGIEVVYWTLEDGMASLTPGVRSGEPGGSNGNGSVLAGNFIYAGSRTTEAFRWTLLNGAVAIGDLPGGEFRSRVVGVSGRGDVLVGYSSSDRSTEDTWESFRWTDEAGMVGLGRLPDGQFVGAALAASVDGRYIVGGARGSEGTEAYRWTAETGMVGLGDLPGGPFESYATTVSADGSVIVGTSQSFGQRAFRWTEETGMVRLSGSFEQERWSRAYGTSWDGNVVVGEMIVENGPFGPFYWTPEDGVQWLTDVLAEHGVEVPDGWHLDRANAVSADGRTIVGYGVNPQGWTEGWVAYLGPGCRADFDDDGTVDVEDVAAYLTAWLNRSIFTDWDYDGSINTRDLLGFLNEWVAKPGCP